MDAETIVARYDNGPAQWQRLLWLATHGTLSSTQQQAYQCLQRSLMEAGNTTLYHQVFSKQPDVYDSNWVTETQQANRQAREVLQSRLAAAQSQLHKDALRAAYLALGQFDAKTGDVAQALVSVLRAKDYCTSRPQTASISLLILELSLHLGKYAQVKEYVHKLEQTSADWEESVRTKVWIASALERLQAGDYSAAAEKLRRVVMTSGTTVDWRTVLAPHDVALYAGLLTLVVGNAQTMTALAEHAEALELAPMVRECLTLVGRRSNYKACHVLLQSAVIPMVQMDVYLAPHLPKLQAMFREKCLLQYWTPYQRVQLSVLASELDFGDSESQWLDLVVQLLESGKLPNTRLDLQTRTLIREDDNDEDNVRLERTRHKLAIVSNQVLNYTYASMVRLACLEYDLSVTDPSAHPSSKRRGGRGAPQQQGPTGSLEDLNMGAADSSDDDEYVMEDDMPMVDAGDAAAEAVMMNPEDLY